jgi:tetratricopeptide (TPR) repeat protein/tRNA A-37 threonylcarbamoyl transferase component Bud32
MAEGGDDRDAGRKEEARRQARRRAAAEVSPEQGEAEVEEQAPALEAGAVVHRYVVEGEIGAGAMGRVYAAHDRELSRRVALKLLRHPRRDSSQEERLLREAKALARLSHPNVVAVYDAGSRAEGVFLVMELVDGLTLRAWLDEQARTWRQVLEVFRAAGEGLAAAHAAGIIHRDFKPDNVLIDRGGRVRVTDFGIAQLEQVERDQLVPGRSQDLWLTATGAVLGTPAYMAPEQWDETAEIDGRADQFSFCVALYEGIYGQRPFAGETLTELVGSVERGAIRESPRDRGEPAWLRQAIRRGLARAPRDRFPDMRALLDAIGRDPARGRRRWIAAGVAAAVLAVLAAGAVVLGREPQAAPCQGAAGQAAASWNAAVRAALRGAFRASKSPLAEATTGLVEQAIDRRVERWIRLRTSACEATRVRREQPEEALDLVMACLDGRLAEMRELTRALSGVDAEVVAHAVQAVEALPAVEACADAARRAGEVPPPEPAAAARVAALRDRQAKVNALYLTARYRDALEPARALATEARALGYRPVEAEALLLLGKIQRKAGDSGTAETTLSDAVAAAQAGRTGVVEMESWLELVRVVGLDRDRFADARRLAQVARGALARAPMRERFEAAFDEWEGALFIAEDVDREASRPFLERAMSAYRRLYGPNSLEVVAIMRHLADLDIFRDEYDEALRIYRAARAIAEKALGPEHPDAYVKLAGEGVALDEMGRRDEALATYRRGLELTTRVQGEGSLATARYLTAIGLMQMEAKQYRDAQNHLQRALTAYERGLGPDHPQVALAITNLTTVLRPLGRTREALGLLDRAVATFEKLGPPGQINLAGVLMNRAETYLVMKDPARARQAAERGLAIIHKASMPERWLDAWGTYILGRALHDTGHRARGLDLVKRSLAAFEVIQDPGMLEDIRAWLTSHGARRRDRTGRRRAR